MSSAAGAVDAGPNRGGTGRPKKPGWWWKKRRERLKYFGIGKQRQVANENAQLQEIPTAAFIEELPDDDLAVPVAAEANTASAFASPQNATSVGGNKKKNKRRKKKYEDFVYRPSHKPAKEFERLCSMMDWNRGDAERESAWEEFASAMAFQFEARYGRDVDDLSAWQRLCVSIGIMPVPTELEKAREAVFNRHVNLIDLTLCPEGTVVQPQFSSELGLSRYTLERGKYPRSKAVGTLLYSLLRKIVDPPPEGSVRDSRNIIVRPNQ